MGYIQLKDGIQWGIRMADYVSGGEGGDFLLGISFRALPKHNDKLVRNIAFHSRGTEDVASRCAFSMVAYAVCVICW